MQVTANPQTVSVVGLGNMGTALAQAFLAHHHRVTLWNRSPRKCDLLRSLGANVAESVASAVAANDVVVVCVLDYKVSDSLIHTPEVSMKLKGKVVLQLSTGTPQDARGGEGKRTHGPTRTTICPGVPTFPSWSRKRAVTSVSPSGNSMKRVMKPQNSTVLAGLAK